MSEWHHVRANDLDLVLALKTLRNGSTIDSGTSVQERARVLAEMGRCCGGTRGLSSRASPSYKTSMTGESRNRILVVDDEARITSFVSRALSAQEFAVETAENGTDGLRLARSGRYDLVFLDLLMPGLDGVSVLKRLLASELDQPVLVRSASWTYGRRRGVFSSARRTTSPSHSI